MAQVVGNIGVDVVQQNLTNLINALTQKRLDQKGYPPSSPGIYAIGAKELDFPKGISVPQHGIIYVGISNDLAQRNHFVQQQSGFNTLRRSLGALFKEALRLNCERRAPGPSNTNWQNYKFDPKGEARLSQWMMDKLYLNWVVVSDPLLQIEKEIIGALKPPLNLTRWPNPNKKLIQALRDQCKQEARLA